MLITAALLVAFSSQVTAYTGATVHTFVPGSEPGVATILVDVDRIVDVGASIEIPPDAKRVDLSGFHVIPGLVDGFVSHDPDHDRLYVSAGVTLVRDTGNEMTRMFQEITSEARARGPGPWIWNCGGVLDGYPPVTTAATIVRTPEEVQDKLPRLIELGQDFFSVHLGIPLPAWRKTIELAHKSGKQVWGPVPRGATLADVLDAGQDGIYHLECFLPAGMTWDKVNFAELEPAIEFVAKRKLAITPTLSLFARRLFAPEASDQAGPADELNYLGPIYASSWLTELETRTGVVSKDYLKAGVKVVELQGKVLARLHELGVVLVPGTTSPNPWHFPGDSLIDELLLWKRAGLAPRECVRLATQGACTALGIEYRGTLERGKVADFVVTRADPTEDLNNLRLPAKVVLRGDLLEREELDRRRAELRAKQRVLREAQSKPLPVGEPEKPTGDLVMHGSVETTGAGIKLSAERYVVVRRYDGSLVYSGRVLSPGQAALPASELFVQQTIRGGELVAYEARIEVQGRVLTYKGELAGGKMSVERRIDGKFFDNNTVSEKILCVDFGSVTTELVLGYHGRPGEFNALYLEGYEPAHGRYELRVAPDGSTHHVRTASGEMKATFDAIGAPKEVWRQRGTIAARTRSLEAVADDGKGLPTPLDKQTTEAGSPR